MKLETSIDSMLDEAARAVQYARGIRDHHAKRNKRGSRQREIDIQLGLERLAAAMKPVRRSIARLPYEKAQFDVDELRAASQSLQVERRKLWKMKAKPKKRKS
jgi:hypothetical protein